MNQSDQVFREWDETYRAVIALYVLLKSDYYSKLHLRKSVPVSHLDFLCDVETRAKQAFSQPNVDPSHYSVWMEIMLLPEEYVEPDQTYRWLLGEAFEKYDLGVGGAYRGLYWKIKNEQMRAALAAAEDNDGTSEYAREA